MSLALDALRCIAVAVLVAQRRVSAGTDARWVCASGSYAQDHVAYYAPDNAFSVLTFWRHIMRSSMQEWVGFMRCIDDIIFIVCAVVFFFSNLTMKCVWGVCFSLFGQISMPSQVRRNIYMLSILKVAFCVSNPPMSLHYFTWSMCICGLQLICRQNYVFDYIADHWFRFMHNRRQLIYHFHTLARAYTLTHRNLYVYSIYKTLCVCMQLCCPYLTGNLLGPFILTHCYTSNHRKHTYNIFLNLHPFD